MALVIEKHRSFRNRSGKCQCYFPSQETFTSKKSWQMMVSHGGARICMILFRNLSNKEEKWKAEERGLSHGREAWAQGRWAVSRSKCISTSPLKCVAAKATSHWGIGGSGFWIFPCCGLCCLWWAVLTISGSQRWLLSDSICISGTW